MKANTRLAGHELRNEGRVYDPHGYVQSAGVSRCSCGALSPALPSPAARKRWHREHKDAVRAAQTTTAPSGPPLGGISKPPRLPRRFA